MCWLLQSTVKATENAIANGADVFSARNSSQVYLARDLTKAYAEYYALINFQKLLKGPDAAAAELRSVMESVYFIYGYFCLEKHLTTFYQVHFCNTFFFKKN